MANRFFGGFNKIAQSLSAFKTHVIVNITPDFYQLSTPIAWAENTFHGFQRQGGNRQKSTTTAMGVGAAGVAAKGKSLSASQPNLFLGSQIAGNPDALAHWFTSV